MASDGFERFVLTGLALYIVAGFVSAAVTPPDVVAQLTVLGPLLPVVMVVAYLLGYKTEFDPRSLLDRR